MVTCQKSKVDLNEKKGKKGLSLFQPRSNATHFVTVIKKIKTVSVYEKQWEIWKEEPTGTLNFRVDFD